MVNTYAILYILDISDNITYDMPMNCK